MILSKKYKEELDKIFVSEELKNKILKSTEERQLQNQQKSKSSKILKLKYTTSFVACVLTLIVSVTAVKKDDDMNLIPKDNVSIQNNEQSISKTEEITTYENNVGKTETEKTIEKSTETLTEKTIEKLTEIAPTAENDAPNNNKTKIEKSNTNKKTEIQKPGYIPSQNDLTQNKTSQTQNVEDKPAEVETSQNEEFIFENSGVNEEDTNNENVECGSSFIEEFNTISEIKEKVGYNFEYPKFIPNGYKIDSINLMFNSFIQISYVNGDMIIDYRTQNENGDISGDYNIYEDVENINIDGREICIKGNDNKFYTAVYTGENSFSIYATQGLDKESLIEIIKSIN